MMRALGRAVQNGVDLRSHLVDGEHSLDAPDEALRLVIRQDRLRLRAIFGHAGAHRLLVIVGATLALGRSAIVADARHLRRPEAVVITGPATGAGEAAGDALHQLVLV